MAPLACSGASSPPSSARSPAGAHAPSSPDPCEVAAALRGKVAGLLAGGRLHRTSRLIQEANRLCPKSAPKTWAAEVATLAELGTSPETRALAAKIEKDAQAGAEARQAAREALARRERLDKAPPEPEEARKEALRLSAEAEAIAGQGPTDPASLRAVKEKYLAAWDAWHLDGQALAGAGVAAKRLGENAEAQRLFDRAIAEAERAQKSEARLELVDASRYIVRAIAWSEDGRRIAVGYENDMGVDLLRRPKTHRSRRVAGTNPQGAASFP